MFYGGHGLFDGGIGGFGQGIDNGLDPSGAIVVSRGRVLIVGQGGTVYGDFAELAASKLSAGASIDLFGCGTQDPDNPDNLVQTLSNDLPDASILGSQGTVVAYDNGFHLGLMETFRNGARVSGGLNIGKLPLGGQ